MKPENIIDGIPQSNSVGNTFKLVLQLQQQGLYKHTILLWKIKTETVAQTSIVLKLS